MKYESNAQEFIEKYKELEASIKRRYKVRDSDSPIMYIQSYLNSATCIQN